MESSELPGCSVGKEPDPGSEHSESGKPRFFEL